MAFASVLGHDRVKDLLERALDALQRAGARLDDSIDLAANLRGHGRPSPTSQEVSRRLRPKPIPLLWGEKATVAAREPG